MTVQQMKARLAFWRARKKVLAARHKTLTTRLRRVEQRQKRVQGKIVYWQKRIHDAQNPDHLDIFGIDYAWGRPDFNALKAAGVKYVLRYISHDAGKDLDVAEMEALHRHGIKVGLVYESTANRALGGAVAGKADATFALNRLQQLGLVKGASSSLVPSLPVYFAVDWDVTDAQKPTVNSYIAGAASVLGKQHTGVYGGYHVVKYIAEHGTCGWFWQTYAWSGGLIHASTHIHQYSNGHTVAGVSCDFNHAKGSAVVGSLV